MHIYSNPMNEDRIVQCMNTVKNNAKILYQFQLETLQE